MLEETKHFKYLGCDLISRKSRYLINVLAYICVTITRATKRKQDQTQLKFYETAATPSLKHTVVKHGLNHEETSSRNEILKKSERYKVE